MRHAVSELWRRGLAPARCRVWGEPMRILVLGGTVFLSRTVAATAVAAGHDVTTFSRGVTGTPVAGARVVHGDRNDAGALAQLPEGRWDLVFDTGYTPHTVRTSAQVLEPVTDHYCFVSSINAFPGWPEQADYRAGGVFDGDPDATGLPDGLPEEHAYGWQKVAAERVVLRAFGPDRCSVLRAGLIVGPEDGSGRLPWWIDRMSRGGDVLAPGVPQAPVRVIDARDLAAFALLRRPGTFEVTGPVGQITREGLLSAAAAVTGGDARVHWVPDDALQGKVEGWTELPLWSPAAEAPGLFAHDTSPAEAVGLTCRPVIDTVADTWEWMGTIAQGWTPSVRTPGLDPAKEQQLLRAAGAL